LGKRDACDDRDAEGTKAHHQKNKQFNGRIVIVVMNVVVYSYTTNYKLIEDVITWWSWWIRASFWFSLEKRYNRLM